MQYSLRTLLIAMLLGGPSLAICWWLRHTWTLQVLGILVAMVAALSLICSVLHAVDFGVRFLFRNLRRSVRFHRHLPHDTRASR